MWSAEVGVGVMRIAWWAFVDGLFHITFEQSVAYQ